MVQSSKDDKGADAKKVWTRPTIVEIPVGMEINSYACAELSVTS